MIIAFSAMVSLQFATYSEGIASIELIHRFKPLVLWSTDMFFTYFSPVRIVAAAACLLAACVSLAQTSLPMPEATGVLVYRGETFSQRKTDAAPLFRYERRIQVTPTSLTASHTTRDPAGKAIIVESAIVSLADDLQRFEVTNQQAGFTGSVQASSDGRRLEYELNDNGKLSKATEEVSSPVVCGPSLFGFIVNRWDLLQAGATIPVRMLVIKEKTSYGFDLKLDTVTNGQASFTITPSSFLVRLAISPLRVVFDANTKTPLRYEGRVPPMENVAGKLKDLDARVEYTLVSASYR